MVSFQPNMQAHDDLAALFSRNLTFNPELQVQQSLLSKPADHEPKQLPGNPVHSMPDPNSSPITYSASQHYTHSAHLINQAPQAFGQQPGQEPQRRSSEPPQSDHVTVEVLLSRHGVNHTQLSPSQMQLFRISGNPQRERLIEIWRAAPPNNAQDNPSLAWSTTTLEQEELWARLRYEERQRMDASSQDMTMSLDGTPVAVPTPAQTQDSRWVSVAQSYGAEPYMMSGYEELMRRENERQAEEQARSFFSPLGSAVGGQRYNQATDPVYKNTGNGWAAGAHQMGGPVGNMEAMEIM